MRGRLATSGCRLGCHEGGSMGERAYHQRLGALPQGLLDMGSSQGILAKHGLVCQVIFGLH